MIIEDKNQPEIDFDEGAARFSGNIALYEKFLFKFLSDITFDSIKEAMEKEDFFEAFKAAHTLKGVSGNLSLVRLYEALIPFVEMLRDEKDVEGAKESLSVLKRIYAETIYAVEKKKEELA